MSLSNVGSDSHPLEQIVSGEDRYVHFAENILDVNVADTQARILSEITNNKNTVICSGNGVGKSYAVAILCVSFLYANPKGSVLLTSGSYAQMESTVWSEMQSLVMRTRERGVPLPGTMKAAPPRIEFDDYPSKAFRAISTSNPDSLEGRHAETFLVVVDEADKPEVSREVIESARSSVTDGNDRFVVIGNPPRSESNSMYELMTDDNFNLINFSSFDSHNIRHSAELDDGESESIPGLVGLDQLKEDYELWCRDEFPGIEAAMSQVEADDDGVLRPTESGLDERWVRRRLGAIPDAGTEAVRPFYAKDVVDSIENWESLEADESDALAQGANEYDAFGADIARGGSDRTIVFGVTETRADVLVNRESPGDHRTNKRLIRNALGDTDAPLIVDAVGEGSGVADELSSEYDVTRFKAGSRAQERSKYYDKRTEALGKLGEWLADGAIKPDSDVATELRAASRHIEFTEKSTRNDYSWTATSKSELKKADRMGRSPDVLDALSLAVWGYSLKASTSNAAFGFY